VWLASSLLSDALAVAAQSLVARSLAAGDAPMARAVVGRSVGMAAGLGLAMAVALAAGRDAIPPLFTRDPAVLELISGAIWVAVVGTQPLNSSAFVWDGVLFGAGGFRYACLQMAASAAPAVAVMAAVAGRGAPAAPVALAGVWAGLGTVMALRWLTIFAPYYLRQPPFDALFPTEPKAVGAPRPKAGGGEKAGGKGGGAE
jgi:Na+-driven multidrug efflux pump